MSGSSGTLFPSQYGLSRAGAFAGGIGAAGTGRKATIFALPPGHCILYSFCWQIVAFAMLAAQLVLVCAFGAPTMLVGLAGVIGLFIYRPLAGATVFLQILLYQNLFLSIFSGWGIDQSAFTAVQGLNFGSLAGMAAVAIIRILQSADDFPSAARVTKWTCISLAVIVVYTGYGMLGSSSVSALIYFRNTSAMLLTLLVGLDIGRVWSYRTIAVIFLSSLAVGLVLASIEYAAPYAYYAAIHARDYTHLRAPDADGPEIARSVGEIVKGRIVPWFNITGGAGQALSVRIFGPNMEAVSYAYVIACAGIVCATLKRFWLAALAVCLLLVAGVKGPLLTLVLMLCISALWWFVRDRRVVLAASLALLVVYVVQGITIGMSNGDFHVLGLLGGVNGLLKMPWGHGIGVGGNLSATALEGLDWQAWQKTGVDFALESAVGVLLYQMGVAAAAVYGPMAAILKRGFARPQMSRSIRYERTGPRSTDMLFVGIAVMLANGFFQEEAYSPYALGLLMLLGGIVVGNSALSQDSR